MSVQMTHKGGLVVQRRHIRRPVIPAPGRRTTERIQAVGQRGAGHRGEPAVADRELPCQVVVDRHIGAVVIAHDAARVAILDSLRGQGRGRAGHETAHVPTGDLSVDRARGMIRVHPQDSRVQMVDGVGVPLVVVGQAGAQTIDLRAPTAKGQIPEHVIEGPVLQHHDHNMVDFLQVDGTGWITRIHFGRSSVAGQAGNKRIAERHRGVYGQTPRSPALTRQVGWFRAG